MDGEINGIRKEKGAEKLEPSAEKPEPSASPKEPMDEGTARKLGRIQFVLVVLLFLVVICITEGISIILGKTAGTAALVLAGIIVAAFLYKKELSTWLDKKVKRK